MRRSTAIFFCMLLAASAMMISPTGLAIDQGTRSDPIDDPDLPPIGFYRGILPIPADNESLDSAYLNVSSHSQFVPIWGKPSPFYNLSSDLEGWWGDTFVDDLVRGNGMFPLIHLNFYRKEGGQLVVDSPANISSPSLNNTAWRNTYKKAALDVLNTERPRYISIGNEVNRWFEEYGATDPDNGFHLYVSLYEEIYTELKAVSPETEVFCTFSREMVSEGREADLSVLELFNPSKMDILMFTTYPYALPSVSEPADLPDDYYLKAFDHIDDMRIGFSEIGWPSDPSYGGEQGQVDLIENITWRLTMDRGMALHMLGWARLADLPGGDQTGLRYRNGTDKLSLDAWMMNEPPSYNTSGRQITLAEDFGTHILDLSTIFYDPDPWDRLSFTVWNGTNWTREMTTNVGITINGHSMELRSIENRTGSRMFQVMVADWQGETDTTFFQVTLTDVNDPPIYLGDDEPYLFLEDHVVNLDLVPVVEDSDDYPSSLDIEVIRSPHLKVGGSHLIMTIQTLEYDWYGTTYIEFRVSDPSGLYFEINKTVEVIPVNDPPEISGTASVSLEEDGQAVLNLSGWGSDVEGDPLEWGYHNPIPENISVDLKGYELRIIPAEDWSGQVMITLILSDGMDNTTYPVLVKVEPVNDAPTFQQPEVIVIEEDGVALVDLESLFPDDPDGDRVHWEVGIFSDLIQTSTVIGDDTLRVQPVLNGFGEGYVNISLVDYRGARLERRFPITVTPVNDPPLFIAGDDWVIDMEWGGSVEFDLGENPFVLEDIDTPMNRLVAVTDSEYCAVDGLLVNLTLPAGYKDVEFQVSITVHDDQGGVSEVNVLTVRVQGAQGVHVLNLTLVDLVESKGRFELRATGGSGQTIWVVFSDSSSYRMVEVGSGTYGLILNDPGWEDGQIVSYHLSMTEGGPNDSIYPASEFTYLVIEEEDDPIPTLVMILIGLVVLGVSIILFATFKKSGADELRYDEVTYEE